MEALEGAPSAITLGAEAFSARPNAGDDLFRGLAHLPGLAADDISAQFWVRGAPNSEVRVRLDGVDLIEPFHLKDAQGALSIVDPTALAWLELVTGGFPADHGDRVAGVLTMETRGGVRPRTAVNLSLTGAGARAEGGFAGGRGRFLVSFRRGFPELALRASGQQDHAFPAYYDALAKAEFDVSPGQVVSVHALHAGDTLRYTYPGSPRLRSGYGSTYAWVRWRRGVGSASGAETIASWSRLSWSRQGDGWSDSAPFRLRDERRMTTFATRSEWRQRWDDRVLLRAGAEASTGRAEYDYALARQRVRVAAGRLTAVPEDLAARLAPWRDTAGAFVAAKLDLAAAAVEPSVRFDRLRPGEPGTWNPRLNAAVRAGGGVLRAAWGLYSQAQGLQDLAVADGERAFGRADQAEHQVLGWERALGSGIGLRLEAFQRVARRIRPRWENLENAYDLFPEVQLDRFRIAPTQGRARGLELMVHGRARADWEWRAGYSLARAEDRVDGRWLPRARDQRHALSADVAWMPGERWRLSAAWNYHSGWPTTATGFQVETLAGGRAVPVPVVGPPYGERLPPYHRLDLRVARGFPVARGEIRAHLDLLNVYGRSNLLGHAYRAQLRDGVLEVAREPRAQLPFLPVLGATWEF